MPSSHLILCRPLFLLPPIPPSIRVFSKESTLRMRWPKYWSFSFSISPSKEHPGLISFRMDWLDLLAVQGTLESLLPAISKCPVSIFNFSPKLPRYLFLSPSPKKCYQNLVSLEMLFQVFEMQLISISSAKIPLQKSDLIPTRRLKLCFLCSLTLDHKCPNVTQVTLYCFL